MRLSHNLASLNVYKNYSKVVDKQAISSGKISSGYKVTKAKDDPNDLAKSERLRMQIRGMQMAGKNVQDGISMLQVADGALKSINEMLIRIRELAVKSGNGTCDIYDKQIIQNEINELTKGIDDIASNTDFNGVKIIGFDKVSDNKSPIIINMPAGFNIDDKISIPMYNLNSYNILGNIDVVSDNSIDNTLKNIDTAIDTVSSVLSKYGALENRFEDSFFNINEIGDKMQSAESDLRDVDIAYEMIEFAKNNILIEAGNALMVQTNRFPQEVLKILENMKK
ncbi:flagellin N-terminal helical domain-containing protein [Clostridium prolinivorans]|jgi:flagellin|uniref:flagellin N-terminal helical domain-containing protein n=1 Tax=Clostridium prolinivorans TaxID=2769420 RepID=UPI000FD99FD5|nr:flagellin [Clostridium prolinivorans]